MQAISSMEQRISELIEAMTLEEKIGQMSLHNGSSGHVSDHLRRGVESGQIGGVLNEVDLDTVNELQRIAVHDSRLGVPLLVGRDVIHGFETIFPIPLGLAASWNPELVRKGARIAAEEAADAGINWTFAPMVDLGRDPRWGRIAETFGEDPYLIGVMARAMIEGFQTDDLAGQSSIAACAKHFAGYGASESGRDYNTTSIPEIDLRGVHLPPFEESLRAGVATLMTSFSDLNGVPASGNALLLRQVLRDQLGFDGMVVSDWDSVQQLTAHGLSEDDRGAAHAALSAGVDMEMNSTTYAQHARSLLDAGLVDMAAIDAMVGNVLRTKARLGLFDRPWPRPVGFATTSRPERLRAARESALQSVVMLKNGSLPLSTSGLGSLAVIGPMADEPYEQLGTWVFDGNPALSVTPLAALRAFIGDAADIRYARGMPTTRSQTERDFDHAVAVAAASDVAILFMGEESILSGEAHCRADISLPGNQEALIQAVYETGTPIVLVVLAGRPITLEPVLPLVRSVLFAWHPGTMAGPALVDLIFGLESPSGKLPVTFPRMVGQIPIYYAHKNTGRPPTSASVVDIGEIEAGAHQVSVGNTSFYLDAGAAPLFPFGFGLSYTDFWYENLRLNASRIEMGEQLDISVEVINSGDVAAEEVAQLYVRDPVASVTRPVRELKRFARVRLQPGERHTLRFQLSTDDLSFVNGAMQRVTEPGRFDLWVGGSSLAELHAEFQVVARGPIR